MTIHIPPLRERIEDVPVLARYFLQKFSNKYNKTLTDISPQALTILMQQNWSGNVRMLENIMEKTAVFARNSVIGVQEVTLALQNDAPTHVNMNPDLSLKDFLEYQEREYLRRILLLCEGRKQDAAEMMGVDRATLWRKIQKYGLSADMDD